MENQRVARWGNDPEQVLSELIDRMRHTCLPSLIIDSYCDLVVYNHATLDVLSLDVYTNAEVFSSYVVAIKRFLDRGGIIVWGIVPTGFEAFDQEEVPTLIQRLESVWKILWSKGIDQQQLIAHSMLSLATCCLVNPDKERTVERAFAAVNRIALELRTKYL